MDGLWNGVGWIGYGSRRFTALVGLKVDAGA